MNVEYYRKESKENCLTYKKSGEFNISINHSLISEVKDKPNNVVIDLS
jgi:hypothetical protein